MFELYVTVNQPPEPLYSEFLKLIDDETVSGNVMFWKNSFSLVVVEYPEGFDINQYHQSVAFAVETVYGPSSVVLELD